MLTARALQADVAAGMAAGADCYMTKPFSPLELLARVEDALRSAKVPTPRAKPRRELPRIARSE